MSQPQQVNMPEGAGFRPVRAPEADRLDPVRTREFVGDDSGILRVPHLTRVEAVRVGGMEIPEVISFEVPIDTTHTRLASLAYPGFRLTHDLDGSPILQRSIYSLDGIWAKGIKVEVCGEWAEEEEGRALADAEPLPDAVGREDAPPARGTLGRFQKKAA